MNTKVYKPRLLRVARGAVLVVAMVGVASAAHAQTADVTSTATTLYNTLFSAAKIIAGIAFVGAGLAKLVGRMNWGHFGAVCVGCVIMASSQWLVTTVFGN